MTIVSAMNQIFGLIIPALLHPSLLLHVQYSMKILYVPVLIRQNRSSPSMPGSPIQAHDLKYLHSPCTFCLIFLHIVALTPGKCSFDSACLQSVIERVLLSKGSAHFGSESLLHSQHFMAKPKI
jgi:hypothetical protein